MPRRPSRGVRPAGPKPSDLFEQRIHRIHELIEGFDVEVTWDDRIVDPDQLFLHRQIDVTVKTQWLLHDRRMPSACQPPECKVD